MGHTIIVKEVENTFVPRKDLFYSLMAEEAKKAALMECFRDGLRFTKLNDFVCDELYCPLKEI